MELVYRDYRPEDKRTLTKYIESLHDYILGLDPMHHLRRDPKMGRYKTEKLLKLVEEQSGKIIVVESAGKIVAMTLGFRLQQSSEERLTAKPEDLGYIDSIFIDAALRGQGIGGELINRMEDYFKSLGCKGIWIDADAYNTGAVRLYEKMGFQQREIGMLKKI